MAAQSTETLFQNIIYPDNGFRQMLQYFESDFSEESFHLCLLIGVAKKAKKQALKNITEKSALEMFPVDANDIIIQNEAE